MSTTTEHVESVTEYQHKTGNNRLGLWLFLFSDAFVFAALLITRFFLLGDARPEVDQNVGFIVTVMLLISSFFMNRAEIAIGAGDQKTFLRNTLITIVLGTLFLVGVVGVEWQIAPFGTSEGVVGGVFYTMTGMHAFHVLTGVILLLIVYRKGRKGSYSEDRHWAVEAAAVYWHFVDVVWIFYYPALYLIGSPIK